VGGGSVVKGKSMAKKKKVPERLVAKRHVRGKAEAKEKGGAKRPTEHWQDVFLSEFEGESERASVILAAAVLDEALTTLLRSFLVPTSGSQDSLLDGAYAPFSTFNSKIDICYRLGIISSQMCRDLHIIRKIRNEFSHNVTGCNFDNPGVRNRVTELVRSSQINERHADIRTSFPAGPKGDFQITVSWMLWNLWEIVERIRPLKTAGLELWYCDVQTDAKSETKDVVRDTDCADYTENG